MRKKTRAQREAEILERMANRRARILKGREIREFTARIERDAYNYLEQLCVSRCHAKSRALT
jgi:hypothetical protein